MYSIVYYTLSECFYLLSTKEVHFNRRVAVWEKTCFTLPKQMRIEDPALVFKKLDPSAL